MTSLITVSVILFSFWVTIATCQGDDAPPMVATFLADINGVYDNSEQVKSEPEKFDLIQFKVFALAIPALSPQKYVHYVLQTVNNVLYRVFVAQPNEDDIDNFLNITFFAINDQRPDRSKPVSPEELVNYKREQFIEVQGCYSIFLPLGNGSYRGEWNDCNIYHNWPPQESGTTAVPVAHHNYIVTFKQDNLIMSVPEGRYETDTFKPYNFKRIGPRFPLPFNQPGNTPGDNIKK